MAETALVPAVDAFIDDFAVPASSPESLRQQPSTSPPHTGHDKTDQGQFSGDNYDQSADSGTEHELELHNPTLKPSNSSRSSISSFPASVIHNDPYIDRNHDGLRTPSKLHSTRGFQYERTESPVFDRRSPGRGYNTGFRNPSSVRAMQMCESEYDETDNITPNHRRKNSRPSYFSQRSSNSLYSSPTKRSSRTNTPHKHSNSSSKLKKEFPLVLLHCTLLPPAVSSRGPLFTNEVLEAVLPEEYCKRWRTLQEKITKNVEVRQRGVLIPHPREDYDLLEERLLESLELERPRIRQHHYLGGNDTDSGFESSSQTDSTSSEAEDDGQSKLHQKCPDCGKNVTLTDVEQERKWEVKIYAANGLMRSGAWAAAWSEMEKVDVEVGIWMPEEVRREVDSRLSALQQKQEELEAEETALQEAQREAQNQRQISGERKRVGGHLDERMKEIYGESDNEHTNTRRQEEIDGLDEPTFGKASPDRSSTGQSDIRDFAKTHSPERYPVSHSSSQPELYELIQRRIQLILQDQRNIAIVLLSVLVLFFAISSAPKQAATSSSSGTTASSAIQANISTSVIETISTQLFSSSVPTQEIAHITSSVPSIEAVPPTSTAVSSETLSVVSDESHAVQTEASTEEISDRSEKFEQPIPTPVSETILPEPETVIGQESTVDIGPASSSDTSSTSVSFSKTTSVAEQVSVDEEDEQDMMS